MAHSCPRLDSFYYLFAIAVLAVGCSGERSLLEAEQSLLDRAPAQEKILAMDADSTEISDHRVPCRSKKQKQICVEICHLPPGQPLRARTKIIPLAALAAHLRKGGPHHQRSYMGACHASPISLPPGDSLGERAEEDSYPDEDKSHEEQSPSLGDQATDDEPLPEEDTLPYWCQENFSFDSDCDGFDDETGDDIYQFHNKAH